MKGNTPPVVNDSIPKPGEGSAGGNYNIKWLITTVLAIWPWLLGSITIALIIGNLFLRYTTPTYKAMGEFLINDSKKGDASGDDVLEALKLNNSKINIDNEIEVL